MTFEIFFEGTPDCYIQLGVCTGQHDVRGVSNLSLLPPPPPRPLFPLSLLPFSRFSLLFLSFPRSRTHTLSLHMNTFKYSYEYMLNAAECEDGVASLHHF
jgi:hypothetical protein